MAIGSLEPQFYAQLMQGLGLTDNDQFIEQFTDFEEGKNKISQIFLTKTQAEWVNIFDKLDACVTPGMCLYKIITWTATEMYFLISFKFWNWRKLHSIP